MIEQYEQELKALKAKMDGAEAFAKKLPLFEDKIIRNKMQEDDDFLMFGEHYKSTPLKFGIRRGKFANGTLREMTNCNLKYDGPYFWIYLNTYSMFNNNEDYDMRDLVNKADIFFFDHLNSTFYVEDKNIEKFLDAVNVWYLEASEEHRKQTKQKEIAELRLKLEKLEGNK